MTILLFTFVSMTSRPIYVGYAEDHLLMRRALVQHLDADPQIKMMLEAGNGIVLLEQIERLTILPDVCLIDIQMPEMGGLELLEQLRSRWPSIRPIVLSGYSDEIIVLEALSKGAKGYLAKDSEAVDVIAAIKAVFEGGYYYSPEADKGRFEQVKRGRRPGVVGLSERELEFLRYICREDLSYLEIARQMGMSARGIDAYCNRLFKKLNVRSRLGLAIAAIHLGVWSFTDRH